jgi:chemotaxis protein methyltransferase CheR
MKAAVASREDLDYLVFQRRIREKTGIDLSAYKRPQMERRLRSLIHQAGAESFHHYLQLLEKSPEVMDEFRRRMTINVSELFRNADKFEELQAELLPELSAAADHLRIWSAGCSYGAEAYSLAILLQELSAAARRARILGTDIDDEMLARAREGVFSDADMKNVSPIRRRHFFAKTETGWRAADCLRQMMEFRHHDLLTDPFERGFHLILCRNVVIYFTDEAKVGLYRRFCRSLDPRGVLFIGSTEHIFDAREMGLEPISAFFYRKTAPGDTEGD